MGGELVVTVVDEVARRLIVDDVRFAELLDHPGLVLTLCQVAIR